MPVYRGEVIFIDYRSGINPAIQVHFTTKTGKKMLRMSTNPIMYHNYLIWGFYKFSPWKYRFDRIIRRCQEGGLVNHWIQQTFERMRLEADKIIDFDDREELPPIALNDVQIVFFLQATLLSLSLVIFMYEMLQKKLQISKNYQRGNIY